MPSRLSVLKRGQRIALRIESGTHYITGSRVVDSIAANAAHYRIKDDNSLRSVPCPQVEVTVFTGQMASLRIARAVSVSSCGLPVSIAQARCGNGDNMRRHLSAAGIFDDADLLEKRFRLIH